MQRQTRDLLTDSFCSLEQTPNMQLGRCGAGGECLGTQERTVGEAAGAGKGGHPSPSPQASQVSRMFSTETQEGAEEMAGGVSSPCGGWVT